MNSIYPRLCAAVWQPLSAASRRLGLDTDRFQYSPTLLVGRTRIARLWQSRGLNNSCGVTPSIRKALRHPFVPNVDQTVKFNDSAAENGVLSSTHRTLTPNTRKANAFTAGSWGMISVHVMQHIVST